MEQASAKAEQQEVCEALSTEPGQAVETGTVLAPETWLEWHRVGWQLV